MSQINNDNSGSRKNSASSSISSGDSFPNLDTNPFLGGQNGYPIKTSPTSSSARNLQQRATENFDPVYNHRTPPGNLPPERLTVNHPNQSNTDQVVPSTSRQASPTTSDDDGVDKIIQALKTPSTDSTDGTTPLRESPSPSPLSADDLAKMKKLFPISEKLIDAIGRKASQECLEKRSRGKKAWLHCTQAAKDLSDKKGLLNFAKRFGWQTLSFFCRGFTWGSSVQPIDLSLSWVKNAEDINAAADINSYLNTLCKSYNNNQDTDLNDIKECLEIWGKDKDKDGWQEGGADPLIKHVGNTLKLTRTGYKYFILNAVYKTFKARAGESCSLQEIQKALQDDGIHVSWVEIVEAYERLTSYPELRKCLTLVKEKTKADGTKSYNNFVPFLRDYGEITYVQGGEVKKPFIANNYKSFLTESSIKIEAIPDDVSLTELLALRGERNERASNPFSPYALSYTSLDTENKKYDTKVMAENFVNLFASKRIQQHSPQPEKITKRLEKLTGFIPVNKDQSLHNQEQEITYTEMERSMAFGYYKISDITNTDTELKNYANKDFTLTEKGKKRAEALELDLCLRLYLKHRVKIDGEGKPKSNPYKPGDSFRMPEVFQAVVEKSFESIENWFKYLDKIDKSHVQSSNEAISKSLIQPNQDGTYKYNKERWVDARDMDPGREGLYYYTAGDNQAFTELTRGAF